jgi:cytochrome c
VFRSLLVLTFTLAASQASAQALAKQGEKAFQQCAGCHAVARGQKSAAGPHLAGVVGRKAGTDKTFAYSPAFKKASAKGVAWTPQALDKFLANPNAVAPGTSMSFVNVKNPTERKALVAFLQTKR